MVCFVLFCFGVVLVLVLVQELTSVSLSLSPSIYLFSFIEDYLYSFGRNNYGQLGIGNQIDQSTPQIITTLQSIQIVQIACGSEHTLALTGICNLKTMIPD
jgi:hypothetical protein